MKEIYGIFYLDYEDKILYSAYTTKQLAEKELQILKAKNEYIGNVGKIEKIVMCESETELSKIPKTFVVQGSVEMRSNERLNIEISDHIFIWKNEIDDPCKLNDINFCFFDYKKQSYGFSVLISGEYIYDFHSIVETIVKENFFEFQKNFIELLFSIDVRFEPFIEHDTLYLDFFKQTEKYEDCSEKCRDNVVSACRRVYKKFSRAIEIGFEDIFNTYMNCRIDRYSLERLKEDFVADSIHELWFDKTDPFNLNKCFKMFVMHGTIFSDRI